MHLGTVPRWPHPVVHAVAQQSHGLMRLTCRRVKKGGRDSPVVFGVFCLVLSNDNAANCIAVWYAKVLSVRLTTRHVAGTWQSQESLPLNLSRSSPCCHDLDWTRWLTRVPRHDSPSLCVCSHYVSLPAYYLFGGEEDNRDSTIKYKIEWLFDPLTAAIIVKPSGERRGPFRSSHTKHPCPETR